MISDKHIVLLVGGVGGAKLAYGMAKILPAEQLTIIVNTGDDFWHYGLRICPDLDTITYTLGGVVDPHNGWGLAGDTRQTMKSLKHFGADPWFGLGDRDLATHLFRTQLWHEKISLTQITQQITEAFGIKHTILPMTDAPVPTLVETIERGTLGFQEYFVKYRWQPTVTHIYSAGIEQTTISPQVQEALNRADAIVIGPSNPWLSINPILSVPGMRAMIEKGDKPRIAMTPIIAGNAVKGPTAKIMRELGYKVTAHTVCEFYGSSINGFIIDECDKDLGEIFSTPTLAIDTLMDTNEKRVQVARETLNWIKEIR
jgi:LPPG:FO 2-phospho-L-lactate transferase